MSIQTFPTNLTSIGSDDVIRWRHKVTWPNLAIFRVFSKNIADIHQKLSKQVWTVISYHPWKFQLNLNNTSIVMGRKQTFFSLFGILFHFNPIFSKIVNFAPNDLIFHSMCKLIKIDDSQSLEMIEYNDDILLRNTSYYAI